MLPDFLAMVEVAFCWDFCKKWGAECGFKHGKCGHGVVKSMDDSAFDCTVFGAI
jgi:hypothetical protein